MPRKIGKPKRAEPGHTGAPVGSEHSTPAPIAEKKESASPIQGADAKVRGEYKGEESPEALKGGRFRDLPAHTTVIGARNAERKFRRG